MKEKDDDLKKNPTYRNLEQQYWSKTLKKEIGDKTPYERMIIAVQEGNIEDTRDLLKENSNLSKIVDNDGFSAIQTSVHRGNLEISELLLENGADVNVNNNDFGGLLYSATDNGDDKMVALLLKHNIDLSIKDKDGKTVQEYLEKINDKRTRFLAVLEEHQSSSVARSPSTEEGNRSFVSREETRRDASKEEAIKTDDGSFASRETKRSDSHRDNVKNDKKNPKSTACVIS